MIRFHVSLFLLVLFHTACCCCLNFRTAPPLSLKRTWLDCLSLETVLFLLSQFIFFQKQHIFLTVTCLCVLKSSKFDCEINFRNFRQLMCVILSIYRLDFFSVWPELSKVHEEKEPTSLFSFSLAWWNLMFLLLLIL